MLVGRESGASGDAGTTWEERADEETEEPLSLSEEEFVELVREVAEDEPMPRVFALVEEIEVRSGADLFAWGVQFEDQAAVFGVDGTFRAQCGSADSAHRLFSRVRNIRLVWPSAA